MMSDLPSIVGLLLICRVSLCAENVTVATSKGVVVGVRVNPSTYTGASYDSFLGIPYGQVLARFKPSVARDHWTTPLVAHSDGPACPQLNLPFSEDCLYLNIFTPVNASQFPRRYPVMAYIHGGGFTFGSSSSLQYGPDFLVTQDVILVTLNYRLGAAGFLTLGIPEAPGNLGMYDTMLALQWVQQEINSFGGDPSRVTLFGHSAGSVLALSHYFSPVSSGLFNKAIGQSGPALKGLLPYKEAVRRAMLLADAVGCASSKLNNTELLDCLQSVDIHVLLSKQDVPLPVRTLATGSSLRFIPVVDAAFARNPFFPDSADNLMSAAVNRSKPLLIGFASADGIVKFQSLENVWKLAEDHLDAFIPSNLQASLTDNAKSAIIQKIKKKYFPSAFDQNKILDLVNLYTDTLFAYSTIKTGRLLANFTYGYVYNFRGAWNPMPSYITPYQMTGVFHGAELTYLFYSVNSSQDFGNCSLNKPSLSMRDAIVDLWTSFAKTGVPDPQGSWGPVSSGHYMVIDEPLSLINTSTVEDQHYQFWADLASDNNSSVNIVGNIVIISVTLWTLVAMGL